MEESAFDLGEEMLTRKVEYYLHTTLWNKFKRPSADLAFSNWRKIKYLNHAGTKLGPDVSRVPDDKGGLYLFFVQCHIITGITEFPLYIGRAQLTGGQNLRKRVKEYFQKYSSSTERPKIHRMFKYWAKDLYLAYYPLQSNTIIKDIEKKIINSLVLPMNDQIPDKKIKSAVKAFN